MRVREEGSESGRERGKFVQKLSEVPTKFWEHETGSGAYRKDFLIGGGHSLKLHIE